MSSNRFNYIYSAKTLTQAIQKVPNARSLTIANDGTCSITFNDDTVVEQSAEALAETLDDAVQNFYKDDTY